MSELGAVSGSCPLFHRPQLLRVSSHLSLLQDVAEELHRGGVEHALLGLHEDPVFQQSLEDQTDVGGVFLGGRGKNLFVIQINNDKEVEEVSKDVVYQGLEDGRGISQTEGHDEVFEVPQVGVKARLPFVPLTDTDQVVRIAQVEFSEDRGMREGLESRTQERDGIFIFNGDVIQ